MPRLKTYRRDATTRGRDIGRCRNEEDLDGSKPHSRIFAVKPVDAAIVRRERVVDVRVVDRIRGLVRAAAAVPHLDRRRPAVPRVIPTAAAVAVAGPGGEKSMNDQAFICENRTG